MTDEQLHVVELEPAPREKCEEASEVAANTICTQEKIEGAPCKVRHKTLQEGFQIFVTPIV